MVFTACANPLDVLGPRDRPKIEAQAWNEIRVTYWIHTRRPDSIVERTFTVTNPQEIALLKSSLRTKKTSGLSIGTGTQLSFRNNGDEIWHGGFCFEDTLHLSQTKDGWRSYRMILDDDRFFDTLRELCARNEKKHHRKATIKHVKLRSNLSKEYPKL